MIRDFLTNEWIAVTDSNALKILWCAFFGVFAAVLASYFAGRQAAKAVGAIKRDLCVDELSAKSAAALGLRKIPEKLYRGQYPLLLTVAREKETLYYLPQKNAERGDAVMRNGAAPFWHLLLAELGVLAVFIGIHFLLPILLEWASNAF